MHYQSETIATREALIRQRLKTIFAIPAPQSSSPSSPLPPTIPADRQAFIQQFLPPQWISLYQRRLLTPPAYSELSEDALVAEIRKQWGDFIEHSFPTLDAVLKAQRWIWQSSDISERAAG